MERGKLIIIEGLDGSGKTVQTEFLVNRLKKGGFRVATFDFPQYYTNFFGKMVGRYLSGEFGASKQVSPYLSSILYALDRFETKEKIEKALKQGKIVVCNRYTTSNQTHQAGKIESPKELKKFLSWLEQMEYQIFKIPKPDLVLFLEVPYQIGQKLVDGKSKRAYLKGAKRDIHERDKNHLQSAQKAAKKVAKLYGWITIKCFKNKKILAKEVIAEKVWQTVRKNLENRK